MSGGFFRGTSADQDTRFSNKQAKLLKSQKFAPELDHPVDITTVKMDVVRPWIANRVTELLGFEDEVLINFIYSLLDGKDVNGKEVQIHLTGFMEKNTGKFMKELWTLLLSAQNNASGVPQQFLDAKEEETRKKMAEADRITNEIQKKKEKEMRDWEQNRAKLMDGEADILKANNAALEPISKHATSKFSSDEREMQERNGLKGRKRASRSPLRSASKSSSRSYSDERRKSRSLSRSPHKRGHSVSSERAYWSPRRRSITPRRRYSPRGSLSPSRRRSSHSRRRSPSPIRRRIRSPVRHRLPSLARRRSPSPARRHSPYSMKRRSPSPVRRKSPSLVRRRSPSPVRRRSPSPVHLRSRSPVRRRHRRSPSTPSSPSPPLRRRSPFPGHRRSPIALRRRSPSPDRWSSPSPARRRSPSPMRRRSESPSQSPPERVRTNKKRSPSRHASQGGKAELPVEARRPISLRSPQRDLKDQKETMKKGRALSPSQKKAPLPLESLPSTRKRHRSGDRRSASSSSHESPVRRRPSPQLKSREQMSQRDNSKSSYDEEKTNYTIKEHKPISSEKRTSHSTTVGKQDSPVKVHHKEYTPERLPRRSQLDETELKKKDQEIISEKDTGRAIEKIRSHASDSRDGGRQGQPEITPTSESTKELYRNNRSTTLYSGSDESDENRVKEVSEKKRHRKMDKKAVSSDDYSSGSQIEDRKEAKRRKRREEKRLKKEERRRRREERRRRREERHAGKHKSKPISPSDSERNQSNAEETETEQKKLEIELREKALQSLRAKKGIGR